MDNRNSYQLLIEKLDQFTRKYYLNQLIRGSLYTLALVLVLFLGLNFMEYHFYFDPGVRSTLFWSFVVVSIFAIGYWVAAPLLRYFRLGKIISHEQAARIIGSHFSNVEDKLLNILQLKHQASEAGNHELIFASIEQKSDAIKLVPFPNAIDLSKNRKYLRYALPPLLLLLFILWAAPSLIEDSTNRLVHYNKRFEKPAPFHFLLPEEDLKVVQYGEFPLTVTVDGEVLPNDVFINVDNIQYRLNKVDQKTFTYRFSNVQKNTDFRLFSGTVESDEYTLEVLKKPNISGFEVALDYPAYTGRKDESLQSIGDLVVPAGTKVTWTFSVQNADQIDIRFLGDGASDPVKRLSDDLFSYSKRILSNDTYRLFISNKQLPNADSVTYTLGVIPDQYPVIEVEKFADSTDSKLLYFVGDASDDYGLLSLSFNYRLRRNGQDGELQTLKLEKPQGKAIQYSHVFDLKELGLKAGDEVTYYFEVYDNDAVNGSKASRTMLMAYAMPTMEEYEKMTAENNEAIKDKLKDAMEESRKIKEEMKKLHDKVLQQNEMDWQTRKELEKLLDRQKELQKQMEEAQKAFEENMKNQEEFDKPDQNMQEKQEQMQELMENLQDKDMQELMQKIEELLQKLDKEQALDMMKDMQSNNEQKEKDLDRMMELFKQLEFEYEMQQTIDKLEQLAEKQEKLADKTEKMDENKEGDQQQNGEQSDEDKQQKENADQKKAEQKEQGAENQNGDKKQEDQKQQDQNGDQQSGDQNKDKQSDLEKKQEEINKEFEKIEEQMEELEKKNEKLQNKKDFDDQKQEREDINEDLQDSQKSLQQSQNQKASRKQKSASQKMKSMANNMQMQMQSQQMEQMELDLKALRQLLENVVTLSFEQEDLMNQFAPVEINTPRYTDLTQEQKKIQDDFKVAEDSLYALAKRVMQMESFITEKVGDIKDNMRKSLDHLEERQKAQASEQQQRAMKNLNDLALMLSETMQQMQQQMAGMMAGSQMCTNPGGNGSEGNVPMDKITQGQQQLNEGMQQMKDGMEGGNMPSSKEFAQMAARQAALRKALREKQQKLQQQGKGNPELESIMDQMNKIETELVNKQLTNEMMMRQKQILTRLLEHDRAERQQEYDNKRKSETAKDKERKLPPSLEEYIKKREAEVEMFKTVSPSLKPYYKQLVEEYYKQLKEGSRE